MQQTTQHPVPARTGLFRRILLGEPDPPPPPPPPPIGPPGSQIFDARPITEPDMSLVYFRLERVEAGVKLIAETMKRACGEILTAIGEVRDEETGLAGPARDEIDALIREAVYPLRADLDELLETVNTFPHVLAAATDDLTERLAYRANGSNGGPQAPEGPETGGARNHHAALIEEEDDLPLVSFDLDPIDLGFEAEDVVDVRKG
jgi:hypothetical protein